MAGNMIFFYFGDDEAYFRTLHGEFKKHTRMAIDFKRIYESDEKKIQSLFLRISKQKASVVFIDFSKQTQDYLHLARIIARTPRDHKLVTIGLVDYLSPPEVRMESIATGVNLTHIKSAETYDVIFDVTKLLDPNQIGEHGFATAGGLKEEWDAGVPVKVGYVHGSGLHIETDHKLEKANRIKMAHHWTEKRMVPSKEFFVKDVSTSNLFYHFKYAVDVEFLFVDEFLPPEGMEQERIDERKKEREEMIIFHRKQLSKWIDDNLSRSLEKIAKVLVVDQEFHFYQDQTRTDKHAYTIRCVPYIEDIGVELDRLQPQVIAYALEKEAPGAKNNNEQLVKLVEALKSKYPEDPPFLIVFNCKVGSSEMQSNLGYPQTMTTGAELSVDVLTRMGEIFLKKITDRKAAHMQKKVKGSEKVFIQKTNKASIAEISTPIIVTKISESDLIFNCDTVLPIGINLHLTTPVDMFINVQPTKTQGSKTPEYQGLIHCMGEDSKKELRRYVNAVFFRDHDAEKSAEAEEFKKLNELKKLEKEEAIKKEAEEKAAKAEQEIEKKEVPAEVKSS